MTTTDRPFVVVSGIPGSGKTRLGRQLAAALALSFFELITNLRALATLGRLDIDQSIDVDTNGKVELDAALQRVHAAFTRCVRS